MDMDKLVSLCKRRGFLFQSSEIYGGLNGFWDYGPLGVELKRNVKEAWWQDMVRGHDDLATLPGAPEPFEMTGLDCTIIMHPQVWKCSGHYDLFHDFMVDCRESKKRYRVDQVRGCWVVHESVNLDEAVFVTTTADQDRVGDIQQRALKWFKLRSKESQSLKWLSGVESLPQARMALAKLTDPIGWERATVAEIEQEMIDAISGRESERIDQLRLEKSNFSRVLGPDAKELGTLTPPREFNLMFKTYVGALSGEEGAAFLRPETAQGIFVNFKNVLDSSRVRVPFGIAQMGKSFRNEITPRNFTFRSREFEQMEIEFFCHPKSSPEWYKFWRDRRYAWYLNLGLAGERLRLRDHDADELSHYSCGTADIEYAFPFLPPGEFGELEGIAHRGDFDLRSHMEGKLVRQGDQLTVELDAEGKPRHRGSGKDLSYRDDLTNERYIPHVIEPSAGADRATLAFLCQAYTEDEAPDENGKLQQRVVMKFHPRIAPVKAAVFPLVKKDGMPEVAQRIYRDLKKHYNVFYDEKGAVGRRYRRQDEAGTPYCITVDGQTLSDGTVTIRDRDSLKQWRIKVDDCAAEVSRLIEGGEAAAT